ncbi:MAG TPA: hypothetical protein VK540_15025 [Polyangiaceae bacterium]|jgi:hypothetical protein|nr:hypothetical protein [Polyangiaceae bacterium]
MSTATRSVGLTTILLLLSSCSLSVLEGLTGGGGSSGGSPNDATGDTAAIDASNVSVDAAPDHVEDATGKDSSDEGASDTDPEGAVEDGDAVPDGHSSDDAVKEPADAENDGATAVEADADGDGRSSFTAWESLPASGSLQRSAVGRASSASSGGVRVR